MPAHDLRPISAESEPNHSLFVLTGNISNEGSMQSCIAAAKHHHGPINILIVNIGVTDESNLYPIG
jgi:NAD(P)-dependent dehydrogenase (short-subunit alcohol dehydrogenase family)